jgi:hypothetical protein
VRRTVLPAEGPTVERATAAPGEVREKRPYHRHNTEGASRPW